MNAIEELIQYQQEIEAENDARHRRLKLEYEQKQQDEIAAIKATLAELFGEIWDEIVPFIASESYNGHWLNLRFNDLSALQLSPFDLTSNGVVVTLTSYYHDHRKIGNRDDLASVLAALRRSFLEHQARQKKIDGQEALKEQYRRSLKEWSERVEQIRAENRRRIALAQERAPAFQVYDLRVALRTEDDEDGGVRYELRHIPALYPEPDDEGYWRIVERGKAVNRRYFQPFSIDREPIELKPGSDTGYPFGEVFGWQDYGQEVGIFYGPFDDPADFLPELLDDRIERPAPPDELDRRTADQISWECTSWIY